MDVCDASMGKFAQNSHLFLGKRRDIGRGGLLVSVFHLNYECRRYKGPHGFSEGLVLGKCWNNFGSCGVVHSGKRLELGSSLSS